MTTLRSNQALSLYDIDYLRWLEATAEAMRQQDFGAIDWENVIEEIEDMGRRERQRLKSNLVIVLLHLLKWQFQPDRRSRSWQASVVEHRQQIRDALQDSPSLSGYLDATLLTAYSDAVERAATETGLSEEQFPPLCPYAVEQILDKRFWPQNGS